MREAPPLRGLSALRPVRDARCSPSRSSGFAIGRHLRVHRRQRRLPLAAHARTGGASPHCWGTAANIYRIGDTYLDSPETIERYAAHRARGDPDRLDATVRRRRMLDGRPPAHRPRLRGVRAARGAGRDRTTSSSPATRCDAAPGEGLDHPRMAATCRHDHRRKLKRPSAATGCAHGPSRPNARPAGDRDRGRVRDDRRRRAGPSRRTPSASRRASCAARWCTAPDARTTCRPAAPSTSIPASSSSPRR